MCFEIDDLKPRVNPSLDGGGRELEQIGTARDQRLGADRDEPGAEPIGNRGWIVSPHQNVPARGVDFVRQREGDGLTGESMGEIAIHGYNSGNMCALAGWEDPDRHAGIDITARYQAAVAAKPRIRPVHVLHRHSKCRGPDWRDLD
jgi:hypothetical protein